MIVGTRVLERLETVGLSQAELARRIGVSQPTISNVIHRSKKGTTHLHQIARELRTTPSYLSGETDDPEEGAELADRLSSEEREWVELYAALSDEHQKAIRTIARGLAARSVSL